MATIPAEHDSVLRINNEGTQGLGNLDQILNPPGPGFAWVIDWIAVYIRRGATTDFVSVELQVFCTATASPADGKITTGGQPATAGGTTTVLVSSPGFRFTENLGLTIRVSITGGVNGANNGTFVYGVARKVAVPVGSTGQAF